jgi:hypothetical protein
VAVWQCGSVAVWQWQCGSGSGSVAVTVAVAVCGSDSAGEKMEGIGWVLRELWEKVGMLVAGWQWQCGSVAVTVCGSGSGR